MAAPEPTLPTPTPPVEEVSEPAPVVPPAPTPAATPAPRRRNVLWLLPVAAAVIAAVAVPAFWYSQQNQVAPAVAADKIAVVRALEAPAPVAAEVKPAPLVEAPALPLVQASITQPEPAVAPQPASAPAEETRNAMIMECCLQGRSLFRPAQQWRADD